MTAAWRVLAALALALVLAPAARADVWGYVDEKGVAHFAAERVDERYQLFFRGGESFDTARGVATPRPVAVPTSQSKLLAFFDVSPAYKQVKHHLREASKAHGVDYELLKAVIATESGFDAGAVSPKGAVGLMQVMPARRSATASPATRKRRRRRNSPTRASISRPGPATCATCSTCFPARWNWRWPPTTRVKVPCSVRATASPITARHRTT